MELTKQIIENISENDSLVIFRNNTKVRVKKQGDFFFFEEMQGNIYQHLELSEDTFIVWANMLGSEVSSKPQKYSIWTVLEHNQSQLLTK
jgi:hypothetical protein